MASTRIRYRQRKRNKDEKESVQRLQSDTTGALYKAVINPIEVTYKVINTCRGEIIRRGGEKINNLEVLKRVVKRELMDLGVKFDTEIRPKRGPRSKDVKSGGDKTTVGKSPQSGLSTEGETTGSEKISNRE